MYIISLLPKHCHSYPKTWDAKSRTFQPYCSRTCANQALGRGNAPAPNNCAQCGIKPKDGNHPFCGRSCTQTTKRAGPQSLQALSQPRSPAPRFPPIRFFGANRNAAPQHPPAPRIPFYHQTDPYYGFTNFSPHPAFKFMDNRPDIAEKIRTTSKFPQDAFKLARMGIVVWHKFMQHEDLKQELLGIGDSELVEDSAEDAFWGIGCNNQG
ncbi:hypothetical protein FB451DRAFT_1501474 [Mycena latifolia]|nr:hypothetical protein FB451DRAFT_1501474 [Mycena latifolia]